MKHGHRTFLCELKIIYCKTERVCNRRSVAFYGAAFSIESHCSYGTYVVKRSEKYDMRNNMRNKIKKCGTI